MAERSSLNRRAAALSPEQQALLVRRLASRRSADPALDEQGVVTGPVPLLPVQRRVLRMFDMYGLDPKRHCVVDLNRVRRPLDPGLLALALRRVLVQHDALRSRFERAEDGWRQHVVEPDDAVPFRHVDLGHLPAAERPGALEATSVELQDGMDLGAGPLIQVALFDMGDGELQRLLLVVHHLVSDAISMAIIAQDLWTAYQQLERGEPVLLLPKTTSVKRWAEHLVRLANSPEFQPDADYWLGLPWSDVRPLPIDHPELAGGPPSPRQALLWLDHDRTRDLERGVAAGGDIGVLDVIHTALARAFNAWTGDPLLVLAALGHGRDQLFPGLSLARTVGHLTSQPSLLLRTEATDTPEASLRDIAAQRRRIPTGGIGFELLVSCCEDPAVVARMQRVPRTHVAFNFVGHHTGHFFAPVTAQGSVFEPTDERRGDTRALPGTWSSWLTLVHAGVTDGRLWVSWSYCERAFEEATVSRLVGAFESNLNELIDVLRR